MISTIDSASQVLCPECRWVAPGSSCGWCGQAWPFEDDLPWGDNHGADHEHSTDDPFHLLLAHLAEEGRSLATVEEVAPLLGLGRSAAYEAVKRKEIPVLRFGRRIGVPVYRLGRILGVDVGPTPHHEGMAPEEAL